MLRVALVGVPEPVQLRMFDRTLGAGIRVVDAPETPRPSGVDLLVVGPQCDSMLREAQQWFRADRGLMVVLLAEGGPGSMQAELVTTPGIGKDIWVVDMDDVQAQVDAVDQARRRAKHRLATERANARLARARDLI